MEENSAICQHFFSFGDTPPPPQHLSGRVWWWQSFKVISCH